jgi:hypothetical protein
MFSGSRRYCVLYLLNLFVCLLAFFCIKIWTHNLKKWYIRTTFQNLKLKVGTLKCHSIRVNLSITPVCIERGILVVFSNYYWSRRIWYLCLNFIVHNSVSDAFRFYWQDVDMNFVWDVRSIFARQVTFLLKYLALLALSLAPFVDMELSLLSSCQVRKQKKINYMCPLVSVLHACYIHVT